jgi:hypothetical protein
VHGEGTDLQPQHSLPAPPTRPLICQPCGKSVPLSLSILCMGRALTSSLSIPSLLHLPGLSSASHAVSQCLYLSLLCKGRSLTSSLSIPFLLHPPGLSSTSSHAIANYSSLFYLGRSLISSLSITFLLYAPTRLLICQPCAKTVPYLSLSLVHGLLPGLSSTSHAVGQYSTLVYLGRSLISSLSIPFLLYAPTRSLIYQQSRDRSIQLSLSPG